MVPTDYVQVTPTNAATLGITFRYGPTSDWVSVVMPYTQGELTFYGATLELTNSLRHFNIPI